MGEWLSYNPLNGDTIPQQTGSGSPTTTATSTSPSSATTRSRIASRRRSRGATPFVQDDWVGLSLDALGTGQVSYHMMVNPGRRADGHAE